MSESGKRIVIIVVACMAVLLVSVTVCIIFFHGAFAPTNARDNLNPVAQKDMLKTTLEWGRLAPLPASQSQFTISTEGSPFTRSFRSSFYLSKADLENWIKASPGLQDAEVDTVDGSTKKYVIKPADGAQYAETVVDFDSCFIQTYVYWS